MLNPSGTVTVEYNGKSHTADYKVEKGVVTVSYGMATNSALTRGLPAEVQVKQLFLEILEGDHWRF